jgi:6-phosphogluconolactonase
MKNKALRKLHIFKSVDEVLKATAEFFVAEAQNAIRARGAFNVVLAGGNSPKKLYQLLASDIYRTQVEWNKVFFFFGDERYVLPDHADSNFRMAKEALFDPLSISSNQIYAVDTRCEAGEAARAYEQSIRDHFKNEAVVFDLILLGLGDNSHTASLFPHTEVLQEKEALIKEVFVKEVGMYRITFTAPLINMAQQVAFLVYGGSKAEAVYNILERELNIEEYPAQLVQPQNGTTHWFMDDGAAGKVVPLK